MTVVFKVSDNVKEKMLKYYEARKEAKTPPYALFQVKDFDCVTTLYESGKVVFQGIGADIEASMWIAQEKVLNNRIIDVSGKEKKESKEKKEKVFIDVNTIGSDEVGTGDYFGPIVVCASYVQRDDYDFLSDLGVRDSKKLSDEQIREVAPKLVKRIPHKIIVLSNEDYNRYHSSQMNMNMIKAVLHNKVLLSLLKSGEYDYKKIVVDQFTSAKSYYGYLSSAKEVLRSITFMTHAEDQVLSVACSSIIARYYFLQEMDRIGKEVGLTLPLGASSLVDKAGVKIAQNKGVDFLNKIAKISFKNTEKIKELMRS